MSIAPLTLDASPDPSAVLAKAVMRAADRLGVSGKVLARVLGVSEATLSRLRRGEGRMAVGAKEFELGVLFVRLFRSLDAIVGGDERAARAWLAGVNTALDGRPIERIQTIAGLLDVIAYLDARRALV